MCPETAPAEAVVSQDISSVDMQRPLAGPLGVGAQTSPLHGGVRHTKESWWPVEMGSGRHELPCSVSSLVHPAAFPAALRVESLQQHLRSLVVGACPSGRVLRTLAVLGRAPSLAGVGVTSPGSPWPPPCEAPWELVSPPFCARKCQAVQRDGESSS